MEKTERTTEIQTLHNIAKGLSGNLKWKPRMVILPDRNIEVSTWREAGRVVASWVLLDKLQVELPMLLVDKKSAYRVLLNDSPTYKRGNEIVPMHDYEYIPGKDGNIFLNTCLNYRDLVGGLRKLLRLHQLSEHGIRIGVVPTTETKKAKVMKDA